MSMFAVAMPHAPSTESAPTEDLDLPAALAGLPMPPNMLDLASTWKYLHERRERKRKVSIEGVGDLHRAHTRTISQAAGDTGRRPLI
jgi:hypothetical protein